MGRIELSAKGMGKIFNVRSPLLGKDALEANSVIIEDGVVRFYNNDRLYVVSGNYSITEVEAK